MVTIGVLSLCGSAALVGCQAMAMPFLMWGEEPTKNVPAEFPHLEGKKLGILVWADNDTLFEFRNVQLELSEYVAASLKANVKKLNLIANRTVVDYQRSDADWDRKPPAEVGAALGADRVLLIELTQYTTREPDSPHLYRGRISANVKVYDTSVANSSPTYKSTVETVYPPGAAASVRDAAMRTFAADVTGRFHDRKVKVK
jgi:hypothetical protein